MTQPGVAEEVNQYLLLVQPQAEAFPPHFQDLLKATKQSYENAVAIMNKTNKKQRVSSYKEMYAKMELAAGPILRYDQEISEKAMEACKVVEQRL